MTITKAISICAVLALTFTAACSRRPSATTTVAAEAATAAATPAATTASTSPAVAHANADVPAAMGGQTVTARVLETMDASNYTYVRVQAGSKDLWAAASKFKVAVGDTVQLSLDQPMENFHSQALNRDFPVIYFVSQIGTPGSSPVMASGHGSAQTAAGQPATVTTPIAAPKDGMSVADLWKSRATLEGKKVTIRGKVVKYNSGILGLNWIHLQDGSGKADDGSNDITVTSDMEATVGDVITVTGFVTLNKDLGSGYKYPVLIERASIQRAVNADR